MSKIDELKKEKLCLIDRMASIEMRLYSIDKEIEKIQSHNIASAKWFKRLSYDEKKIRNLKHLLRYYESKRKGNSNE